MNKKGFTLVELLAVLIIMALIALITIPAITKIIDKQKKNALSINVKSLVSAAKTDYYNNNRSFGYYAYRDNKFYYTNSDGTETEINVDGKVVNGVGYIYVYQDFDTNTDTFEASIHNTDYCVEYSTVTDKISVDKYDGVCDING